MLKIDLAEASRLIGAQFPFLGRETVRVVEEGGDHLTVEVGEIIFRFPRDARTAAKLERELRLLPLVGPTLPVPVPQPLYVGKPDSTYPFPFAGYHRVPGISGEIIQPAPDRVPALARQAGAFLSALHAFDEGIARARGIEEDPLPEPGRLLESLVQAVAPVRDQCLRLEVRTEPYLGGTVSLPPTGSGRLVVSHADLKGEHVLVAPDGGMITGVIDWTDIALAEPVVDFAGLVIWLGEEFARQVFEHYRLPVGHGFLNRVRFYVRCFAIEQLGLRLRGQSNAPLPLLLNQLGRALEGS